MCSCISVDSKDDQVWRPSRIAVFCFPLMITHCLDFSQKEWLTEAVELMSRLDVIIQVLETAVNQLKDGGRMSPGAIHEHRQTYLLMSSCKLFCMTAQARIYMATSKLPIVPRSQVSDFRNHAGESMRAFLLIYKTFDQEDDLRHLDYFTIVSRPNELFPPPPRCWCF